jgi:hypothetical protein
LLPASGSGVGEERKEEPLPEQKKSRFVVRTVTEPSSTVAVGKEIPSG